MAQQPLFLGKSNTIEVQKNISKIYDHLYATSRNKTPKGISNELGKLLHTVVYLDQNDIERTSQSLFKYFREMNNLWKLYHQDDRISLEEKDVTYIINHLEGINLIDQEKDIFGDILETIRSRWAKEVGGQFFTDSKITHLAVHMLNFKPLNGESVVDICSGTGGFLLAGLNKIRSEIRNNENKDNDGVLADIAQNCLIGQEIDKDVRDLGNATLSSRIGDSHQEIILLGDSLVSAAFKNPESKIRYNSHDCVATNPPFGSKITIKDYSTLKNFQLAGLKNKINAQIGKLVPKSLDVLFIEQNIKLLKPGSGRIAIVLPYQILSGPQALYIRRWLLSNLRIDAVVDLPAETFQPHTGTTTTLLVGTRRSKPVNDLKNLEDYTIFMDSPLFIGHDRRGNPVIDKNTGDLKTDIQLVEFAWDAYVSGKNPQEIHNTVKVVSVQDVVKDSELRLNSSFHTKSPEFKLDEENFEYRPLKELVEHIFYPGRFKRSYVEKNSNAVPFLGGTNIMQYIIRADRWISKEDQYFEQLKVKEGWILITRSGSTGLISSVPKSWDGYAMSEHIIRIITNESVVPSEYLLAYLRTDKAKADISKGIFGSVIDEITPQHIGNLIIPIPKDKSVMAEIADLIKSSETGRNQAIADVEKAISILNSRLD